MKETLRKFFCVAALAALLGQAGGFAAEAPEAEQAYGAALRSFQGGWYDRAEKEFGDFIQKYPASAKVHEALLLRAQSRFELKQFDEVVNLLAARTNVAEPLADEYRFWTAGARMAQNQYAEAAAEYATLLRQFPQSRLRLEASYREAFAWFKQGDLDRAIQLLSDPGGSFQQAASAAANATDTAWGFLLLGEALLTKKDHQAVRETLEPLAARKFAPEFEWRRQYLLASNDAATQRNDAALSAVTNLVALAVAENRPGRQATALSLKAEILSKTSPEGAVETWEQIAAIKGLNADEARRAALKAVDLLVAQQKLTNATQRLEAFIAQNPQDTNLDLISLSAGELALKRFNQLRGEPNASPRPEWTNVLAQAAGHFSRIVQTLTNSPLAGKAYLNLGWCYWEQAQLAASGANPLAESKAAFEAAASRLPRSEEQAMARFKLADCLHQQGNYAAALTNYQAVAAGYADLPEVKSKLADQALYQIVRAGVELKDFDVASKAAVDLLGQHPKSPLTERAVFFFAEALTANGHLDSARNLLAEIKKKFADSPLLAEAELATARTYVRGGDWSEARNILNQWSAKYTNHVSRPQAEFDRAWAYSQLEPGSTNALLLFTNLVTSFPSNALAPAARMWIADYFFRKQDYVSAEVNYQLLAQNPGPAPAGLRYEARLMAGKSAILRQSYSDARAYLTALIAALDRDGGPSNILAEAYFVMGDLALEEPSTNAMQKFGDAINLYFRKIERVFPASPLAPQAWGKIGNCYYQLAAQDPRRYTEATNEYHKAMASPLADVATRSNAEHSIGMVLEKLAQGGSEPERRKLLVRAMNHYLNVVFGNNLRADQGEKPDPFWVKESGLAAGRLAEQLGLSAQAVRLYEKLIEAFPSQRPILEKKLETARQQAAARA